MRKLIPNLTGQRFGRWTVLDLADRVGGRTAYHCVCQCGGRRVVVGKDLWNGHSKSCGCLNSEVAAARARARNKTHGRHGSDTYKTWLAMIARCTRPCVNDYARYGGAGIVVCSRWRAFENFLADMGERPSPRHTIDRIDGTKGYEPGNCQWATMEEQQNNKRSNRLLTFGGKTMSISRWARHIGMNKVTLRGRLERGWPIERALRPPGEAR